MVDHHHSTTAYSLFSYELVNNTVKDLLVRKNGGFNYIIPGLKVPSNEMCLVLKVRVRIPNISSVFIDAESAVNPLDREVLETIDHRIQENKSNKGLSDLVYPFVVEFTIRLGAEHAIGETNEIVSSLFGFNLTLDLSLYSRKVGDNYSSALSSVEAEIRKINEPDSFIVGMLLIDKQTQLGSLWTQLLGDAIRVPVKRCDDRPDGLYIVRLDGSGAIHRVFFRIEELTEEKQKELGIYSNKARAAMGGNGKLLQDMQSRVEESTKKADRAESSLRDTTLKLQNTQAVVEDLKRSLVNAKSERNLSEAHQRIQQEIIKRKQSTNSFGDFMKGLGGIVGLVYSGIKLFC